MTPIPASLRDFVFDFGSLEPEQEMMYVQLMVTQMLKLPQIEGFFSLLFYFLIFWN